MFGSHGRLVTMDSIPHYNDRLPSGHISAALANLWQCGGHNMCIHERDNISREGPWFVDHMGGQVMYTVVLPLWGFGLGELPACRHVWIIVFFIYIWGNEVWGPSSHRQTAGLDRVTLWGIWHPRGCAGQ